ncbi:hypothetical protein EsH8_XII_000033 [Colletotrichum jinshuiense]
MASNPVHTTAPCGDVVLLPVKLDAFVLNEAVCNGGEFDAKIAPITQPNYTFLRLDDFYLQNDVLNHVDLHAASPAARNPRVTDLRTASRRDNRLGVYLHWTLPRVYRLAATTQEGGELRQDMSKQQLVPTRWLVVRQLDLATVEPKGATADEFDAWVVESDRKRDLYEDLTEQDDMEVDVSPFVSAEVNDAGRAIGDQAEVFIGKKTCLRSWEEDLNAPRTRVSVFDSSNQLFPDYQPHNSNVFSMVDPLVFGDGKQKLTKANASYFVIGWHAQESQDPFAVGDHGASRKERLRALSMALADNQMDGVQDWLDGPAGGTRVLCHGAIYDVEWDISQKPPNVPADEYCRKLNEQMPISLGTTPIDALMAYFDGYKSIDKARIERAESSVDAIQLLLRSTDDGVESQRRAEDLLGSTLYMSSEGGTEYHLAAGESSAPSGGISREEVARKRAQRAANIVKLKELNKAQALLDSASRQRQEMQWDMFSLWWRYLSDHNGAARAQQIRQAAQDLQARAEELDGTIERVVASMQSDGGLKAALPGAKSGAKPPFFKPLDPTLLIGGVPTGWEHDFLKLTQVRLPSQAIGSMEGEDPANMPPAMEPLASLAKARLPSHLSPAVGCLLAEFIALNPRDGGNSGAQAAKVMPLYHDQLPTKPDGSPSPWRDRWNSTQPWFPLFMEWEAEYIHIPMEHWELRESTSSRSSVERLSYQIKKDVDLAAVALQSGRRLISGRNLLLPQPVVSLRQIISQLLADTPSSTLETSLPEEKRAELESWFNQLAFLSAPLSGFVDHLTTRFQGSHVKPSIRLADGTRAIDDALRASAGAGFTADMLHFIGDATTLTPYGTSVLVPRGSSVFHPATHGQLRLVKLNIIDKFGQVIHAIDQGMSPEDAAPLYPCISERLRPQAVHSEPLVANTVERAPSGLCEFIQLPPRINQLARLNADFVEICHGPGGNAVVNRLREEENPVWGWLVVNFPNNGLQLFEPGGAFYREIRFGGAAGTLASDNWLPFAPSAEDAARHAASPGTAQLNKLVEKLRDPQYMRGFVNMIEEASRNTPAAPEAYSETIQSIIGRPLALVNAAWSIELAHEELNNLSAFHEAKNSDQTLLDQYEDTTRYSFPVKLGDKGRLFDGLIGYFTRRDDDTAVAGDFYDLDTLNTPYVSRPQGPGDRRREITPERYLSLEPTWASPIDDIPRGAGHDLAEAYEAAFSRNLSVVGAVMDPFRAVHAFSGVLPPKALRLLPWVWEEAFRKMTAFFHLGPMVMQRDVPPLDMRDRLTDRWDEVAPVKSDVRLHFAPGADWAWLQPYAVEKTKRHQEGNSDEGKDSGLETIFMPLAVGQIPQGLKLSPGPYTAIDGYMQVRESLQ